MLKLSMDDLSVTSFQTETSDLYRLPTIDKTIDTIGPISYDPTAMTYCYVCPVYPQTETIAY
ncbi:MAG TPA: hypothetical protein VFE05_21120 [Longimicrobiaceae bacterium]|jgi:hypothetical protein|nr:hypothetical protein [Longimicrobiaceae bacterium]